MNTQPRMTRDEAMAAFRVLVSRYGLQWTAAVPAEAHHTLTRCNEVLDMDDRREAIGLPRTDDMRRARNGY